MIYKENVVGYIGKCVVGYTGKMWWDIQGKCDGIYQETFGRICREIQE